MRADRKKRVSDRSDALERVRIVVASDALETRSVLTSTLRRQGYDAVSCYNGAGLRRCLDRMRPARRGDTAPLVVVDVRSIDSEVIAALDDTLRASMARTIVCLTAAGDNWTKALSLRLGAVADIEAPTAVDQIAMVVRSTAQH